MPSTDADVALLADGASRRSVSPAAVWARGTGLDRGVVFGAWLASLALSIGLGLTSILYDWSGLPLRFAGTDVFVTIYPPLVMATLWTLWFGFWWGFVPAYLATLVLALYSGMPAGWAAAFAFADPLGLAVFAIAYRAIPVRRDLRGVDAAVLFVLLSFVSGIVGSAGSFIWSMTNEVSAVRILPIWQGWWLGAFLQNLLVVAPVLVLAGPAVERLRDSRPWVPAPAPQRRSWILLGGGVILGGVLAFLQLSAALTARAYDVGAALPEDARVTAASLAEATEAMHWIMAIIVLFASYFAHRVFTHWTAVARRAARSLAAANAALAERGASLEAALESERQAHERLRAAQAQLVQSEKMSALAHLVAGVAHEINTPLGIALMAATHLGDETERFARGVADGRVRRSDLDRYVALARESSNLLHAHIARAADLVGHFKQVSADQAGDARRRFDLKETLDALAASLSPALRKAGHTLAIDCPEGIVLDSCPGALGQVVANLVMNAIDHAFPAGQAGAIALRARAGGDGSVEISCSDDGTGIAEDVRAKIFDPFFTTKRGAGNTGLGLHIVYNLVTTRLGGSIRIDEAPRGTDFVITIPTMAPGLEPVR